jgi:hypothetical protein
VATHHLPSIMTKIVTCDNMYIMDSKDELVFVDFFVYPIPFVVCEYYQMWFVQGD